MVLCFVIIILVIGPASLTENSATFLKFSKAELHSFLPVSNGDQSSLLLLGYGPNSLVPANDEIPVFTAGDQFWVESNYNFSIQIQLTGMNGIVWASQTLGPEVAVRLFSFPSNFASSSNFTLQITSNGPCFPNCSSYSLPIQFVNSASTNISSLSSRFSLSSGSLTSSFSAVPNNPNMMPNIEECLSDSSTANETQISIPGTFGTGSLGISTNPATGSGLLVFENAVPSSPFLFSFQLFANYTYEVSRVSGSGYEITELQVASSPTFVINGINSSSPPENFTWLESASLRSGRYLLKAFFQNAAGSAMVDTPILIEAGVPNWFWLGSCSNLSAGSGYSITAETALSGASNSWPSYLLLMYQVYPGIEAYSNYSLNLPLDRITFLSGGSPISSDIHISPNLGNSSMDIQSVDVENGSTAYLLCSHYPAHISFTFSFAGKTFANQTINLASGYSDQTQEISLGTLAITAEVQKVGKAGASVTVHSQNLNVSYSTTTGTGGNVNVQVPPGNYTVYVTYGGQTDRSGIIGVTGGRVANYVASFSTQSDVTMDLIWIASIIGVLGVAANLWYWISRRRAQRFPY